MSYKFIDNDLVTIFANNSKIPSVYVFPNSSGGSSKLTFNLNDYSYKGETSSFVLGKDINSDSVFNGCWGLKPISGDSEYNAYYYKYKNKGNLIPFATKATSKIPSINNYSGCPFYTISECEYSGNSTTSLYIKLRPSTTSTYKYETIISEYSDFTVQKKLQGKEGIFLWCQAAGGGGGGGDNNFFSQGDPGGAGGGSGACALVYLATKKLYKNLGSNAYFCITMGSGGAAGNCGANPTAGSKGDNLYITYYNPTTSKYIPVLLLYGGSGGGKAVWDHTESDAPGDGGIRVNYLTSYSWVLNSYTGVSGGYGKRGQRGSSGYSLTTTAQQMPIYTDNFYLCNGYRGNGSSTGHYGGGGGGSATPGAGYGGNGSQSATYKSTAGGPCFVGILIDFN